jgi:hypothetical protein
MEIKRRVLGPIIIIAKILGWLLIGLSILGLLTANLTGLIGWLLAVALALSGIVWLVLVKLSIQFFDQYLSRN